MPRYRHVLLDGVAQTERYTAVRARSPEFSLPERHRQPHAAHLIGQYIQAREQQPQGPQQVGNGFYESPGLTLCFESEPQFPLAFESLDLKSSKIQLLSVQNDGEGRTVATVFVPENKIGVLLGKLEAYRDFEPGVTRGRENRKLVESISNIKLATLRELWTDVAELYPAANTEITWEVWLRSDDDGNEAVLARLTAAAADFGFAIVSNPLFFIDRTVILVRATREVLSRGVELLGLIAELRKAKVTAAFYSARTQSEQHEMSAELVARVTAAAANAPIVGLLDTGVNHGHPLLAPLMTDAHVQTLKPDWGAHDTYPDGHGTQMAGLALYGDLVDVLQGDGPIQLTHSLHSLKLIHAPDPHRPELYGTVTIEGISRLEIDSARKRAYCMAITADARDRGRPSSWSAAIDDLAFGTINDTRRLIVISAGNTSLDDRNDYAASNEIAPVEDPAQAWNALTVGGYTEKVFLDADEWKGWTPLATIGDLAPSSRTSLTWPASGKVPYKPDIVMEAGNMGRPPEGAPDFPEDLQLLTTNFRFQGASKPFATFHDTSASAALAARLAAQLMARYPDFTPETVRGFMVHSARWSDAMRQRATNDQGVVDTNRLLRTFGYGAPNAQALFSSANNSLTLVAQDTLQPFFKDVQDGGVKTRDIKYHTLPWPRDVLLGLPLNTPVEMRATLSYFIEPSPGERGWDRKYGYPSHGLRYKVIRATEDIPAFKLRVNAHQRVDDYDEDHAGETGTWVFGARGPTAGSIHSNIWTGTAADLANRRIIAVHPTLGWWRTRTGEERYERTVHYSLIVTVATPHEEIDIYTPVAIQVGIDTEVFV